MRNFIAVALAGTVLAVAGVGPVTTARAGERGFIVVNTNAEQSIVKVWTALAGEANDPWEAAAMEAVIAPSTRSPFNMSGTSCLYDVKVEYGDGYVLTFDDVDVCRMDEVIGT